MAVNSKIPAGEVQTVALNAALCTLPSIAPRIGPQTERCTAERTIPVWSVVVRMLGSRTQQSRYRVDDCQPLCGHTHFSSSVSTAWGGPSPCIRPERRKTGNAVPGLRPETRPRTGRVLCACCHVVYGRMVVFLPFPSLAPSPPGEASKASRASRASSPVSRENACFMPIFMGFSPVLRSFVWTLWTLCLGVEGSGRKPAANRPADSPAPSAVCCVAV